MVFGILQESDTVEASPSIPSDEDIQFGYHTICGSQIKLSEDAHVAQKMDPDKYFSDGVTFSAKPLKGEAVFHVKISTHGSKWSRGLIIGVMRFEKNSSLFEHRIPRWSMDVTDQCCIWSSTKVYNRLDQSEKKGNYGSMDLDDLCEGDSVGLSLSSSGELTFCVNGQGQGVAAVDVYDKKYDVYAVIDHCWNCYATTVIEAGMIIIMLYL